MNPNGYESCRFGHHYSDNYWDQMNAYAHFPEIRTSVKTETVYGLQVTLNGIALEAEDITLGQAQELIKKFTEMGATEFVLTPEGVEE